MTIKLEQKQNTSAILSKGKNIQMGIWFDMEDADAYKKKAGVLTKERCSFSCKVFCDYVSAQGYYTGVYTSTSWLGTFVETTYPIWVQIGVKNNERSDTDQSSVGVMHEYSANPIDKNVIFNDIDFYKSDPKKDENSSESAKKDEINVSGINKLIEMLLSIVEKILKLFK